MTRSVLVTGALAGIGRATALAFARAGWNVLASGRRDADGAALAAALREAGAPAADYLHADVREEADHARLVARAEEQFGGLDAAVNNAGVESNARRITEQTVEDYRLLFDTNVLGTFLGLKHQLPPMLAARRGVVVNLSSIFGHKGQAGSGLYVAAKHAIEGMTKAAALEAAPRNVRVVAVAPGPIGTAMLDRVAGNLGMQSKDLAAVTPLNRVAAPEEVAQTILFLCGDGGAFITGTTLQVDGGMSA